MVGKHGMGWGSQSPHNGLMFGKNNLTRDLKVNFLLQRAFGIEIAIWMVNGGGGRMVNGEERLVALKQCMKNVRKILRKSKFK